LIPKGYWKKNSNSETYEECAIAPSNCIGDSDSSAEKRISLNELKQSPNNPMDYYCSEGKVDHSIFFPDSNIFNFRKHWGSL